MLVTPYMPLPEQVLEFLRTLRESAMNNATLNEAQKKFIAKKFLEFNEKGLVYEVQDIDDWIEIAKPEWSYTNYAYIIYAAEIMKYAYST